MGAAREYRKRIIEIVDEWDPKLSLVILIVFISGAYRAPETPRTGLTFMR